jgi:hypothetical protein
MAIRFLDASWTERDVKARACVQAVQTVFVDSAKARRARPGVLEALNKANVSRTPVTHYVALIVGSAPIFLSMDSAFLGEGMQSWNGKTFQLTDGRHQFTVQVTLIAGLGKQVGLYAGGEDAKALEKLIGAAGFTKTRNTWPLFYPMYKKGEVWKVAPVGKRADTIVLAVCDRSGDHDKLGQWMPVKQFAYLESLKPVTDKAVLVYVNICKEYNFRVPRLSGVDPSSTKEILFYGFYDGTELDPIKMKVFADRSYSTCFKSVGNNASGDGEALDNFLQKANIWTGDTVMMCPVEGGYFVARAPSRYFGVTALEDMAKRK